MKRMPYFIFMSLVLLPVFSYTQEIEDATNFHYQTGEPYTAVDGIKNFININEGLFCVKCQRNKVVIQKFNADSLTVISQMNYKVTDGNYFETMIELKTGYVLIFSYWDKINKKMNLISRKLNSDGTLGPEAPLFSTSTKVILGDMGFPPGHKSLQDHIDGKNVFSSNAIQNLFDIGIENMFKFFLSNDSSKILIKYTIKHKSRNNNKNKEVLGLFIFNSNLEKIQGNEYIMPFTEANLRMKDILVDGDGNIFIYTLIKTEISKKSIWHNNLLRIDIETNALEVIEMIKGNYLIKSYTFYEDMNGFITLTGFASLTATDGITSIFKIKYDRKGKEVSNTFTNFISKINIMDVNQKVSINNFSLRKVHLNNDGSIIYIGQRFWYTVFRDINYSNNMSGNLNESASYFLGEIIIIKMSDTEEIIWTKIIPQKQTLFDKSKFSCNHFESNGKHYFTFLDLKEKEKKSDISSLPKSGIFNVSKSGASMLKTYVIDDESGESRKVIFFNINKVKSTTTIEEYGLQNLSSLRLFGKDKGGFLLEANIKEKKELLIRCRIK